jgi:hypothetical protein
MLRYTPSRCIIVHFIKHRNMLVTLPSLLWCYALEVINLLPDIACAIHSIPITSRTMAIMKFNKPIPNNGDAKTIVDIATANIPTPIDNDLEPFDTCLDDAPSIILAIPANNRPTPSKITKNPVAYSGNARTAALNPITRAPKMMFPARENFD